MLAEMNKNVKEFASGLEKRTRIFAVRIIQLSSKIPNTPEGKVIRNQITKAGTSIGANYREANRARSAYSCANRTLIPGHSGQWFLLKADTDSC